MLDKRSPQKIGALFFQLDISCNRLEHFPISKFKI